MATRPPPAMAAADDTFDARWDRWIEKGIRSDRIFDKRAKVALVVVAWTAAIVTVWMVLT